MPPEPPARPDYLRFHAAAGASARLAAVRATELLDTPVDAAFDRFTRIVHELLGAPVCLLTLVDAERDFVKSAVGLPEPLASARQVPTGPGAPSFCQYMVATDGPVAVDDARGHPVFGDFPSVRYLGAVAAAGAPLRGPAGQPLGTLCAIDFAPRHWGERERAVLAALAEAAGAEIALRLEAERAHAALRAREAVLRQFVEHTPAAVALVDRDLRYVAASRRWQQDYGLGDAPVVGRRHDEVFPDLPAAWTAAYGRVLAGETCRAEDDAWTRASGRVEHVRYELQPWRAADGTVAGVAMFTEVTTERRRLERALAHQATHDALTGLANRTLLHERVERALARRAAGRGNAPGAGDGVALLCVDLDDFKAVNDTFGHAAGDRVLVAVAERLLGATRGFDTVARLGGDEFAVLLEGLAGPGDAETVVARVLRALAAPVAVDDEPGDGVPRTVAGGASVGVAHAAPGATVGDLLRDADAAMYQAKAAGKGGHAVFDPGAEAAARAERALEAELRQLLAAPDARHPAYGALALAFQPVVRLEDGRPTSVEALVRWHHPARGVVMPNAFVPLAERRGLVVRLGAWVLGEACRHLARWEAALPADRVPSVAVNVSGRQLDDADLVPHVARVLAEQGVRPERLTLEITETALARDPEAARDVLHALRALGVRLAIDDFGTGYSSLGYLQQFPVDVLKIDKSFVDGVAAGGSGAALARTVVGLADALGLRTVAEGVEQAAQHDTLRALGCGLGQGYLFARPMAPEQFEAWLAERQVASECGERWSPACAGMTPS